MSYLTVTVLVCFDEAAVGVIASRLSIAISCRLRPMRESKTYEGSERLDAATLALILVKDGIDVRGAGAVEVVRISERRGCH